MNIGRSGCFVFSSSTYWRNATYSTGIRSGSGRRPVSCIQAMYWNLKPTTREPDSAIPPAMAAKKDRLKTYS
jgi:hypothetical protein